MRNPGTVLIPEKGRNARYAVEQELGGGAFPAIVNGAGKRVAEDGFDPETGLTWDGVRDVVEGRDGLVLKDTGRRYDRPVIDVLEDHGTCITGVDAPGEAWQREPDRFYAGMDQVVEAGLRAGRIKEAAVGAGLAGAADAVVGDAYDRIRSGGASVSWSLLYAGERETGQVLVPARYRALGGALVEYVCGNAEPVVFDADRDEEAVIADAGIPGIYMVSSGETAESYGLTVERIGGMESRVACYEKDLKRCEP